MGLFKRRTKNTKGFTLIELIVVVAILGILAAVAVPRLVGFTAGANEKTIVSDVKILETAAAAVVSADPNLDISALTEDDLGTYVDPAIIDKYDGEIAFSTEGKVLDFDIIIGADTYDYVEATRTATKQ